MKLFITGQGLREALKRPSGLVLITINLSLLAGVVLWDWSVFEIVFLYWVENLAIGLINVLRMIVASPDPTTPAVASKRMRQWHAARRRQAAAAGFWARHAVKLFLVPFFIVHYGGFCYGHGVFVLAMFGDESVTGVTSPLGFTELLTPTLSLALALLAASHLFSFLSNFLLGGEYRRTHAAELMVRPYGRIVALHITILLGALLTEISGSPLGLLIVLVVMKTGADLALHEMEREKLAATARP